MFAASWAPRRALASSAWRSASVSTAVRRVPMHSVVATARAVSVQPTFAAATRRALWTGASGSRNATWRMSTWFSTRARKAGAGPRRMSTAEGGKESLRDMYMRWLTERPILTKSVTSGIIAMLGDVVCQLTVDKDQEFSVRRCFNMTLLGTALVGPGLHYWYTALAGWIPGTTTGAVLARLALDQTVWAPVFIAVFFSAMSILQGKPEDIIPNLRQNVWAAMLVNWKLWPAANFVNFKFVPVQLQVLFANFVALIWNTYLSWATSRTVVVEDGPVPPVAAAGADAASDK